MEPKSKHKLLYVHRQNEKKFQTKIRRDKEGHDILIKGIIHQEDMISKALSSNPDTDKKKEDMMTVNIYALITGALNFMK
jgi:hypothetical protein